MCLKVIIEGISNKGNDILFNITKKNKAEILR